jgi:hypothetical protein
MTRRDHWRGHLRPRTAGWQRRWTRWACGGGYRGERDSELSIMSVYTETLPVQRIWTSKLVRCAPHLSCHCEANHG